MRILLAIDDSTCSTAAVAAVIEQFKPLTTSVHVIHVDDWPKTMPPSMSFTEGADAASRITAVHDAQRREAAALVASTSARLRAAGFMTSASVPAGDARRAILASAEEWHADLIVVGSHGRKGLDRILLGSVSDGIARQAPCSVEIVRVPVPAA